MTSMIDRLRVIQADITTLDVDAIVNAANSSLLGGGGVDGAIHRRAGPGLKEECRALGGCQTGQAKITGGHKLLARHVIHTVGPVWHGGSAGEAELLASCYMRSLQVAANAGCATVAFPAISTGIYGYPRDEAAEIAISATLNALSDTTIASVISEITFCCFDEAGVRLHDAAVLAKR